MKTHQRRAIAILSVVFVASAFQARSAVIFTASDIGSGNTIQYNYNTKDNLSYINGTSTGIGFAASASPIDNVIIGEPASPSPYLRGSSTGGGAPIANSTSSFVWEFDMPSGYQISSLDVGFRLTVFSSVDTTSLIRLSVSADGVSYTPFASLTGNGTTTQDLGTSVDLTSYVSGSTKYYIQGEFIYGANWTGGGTGMQIFRNDATGYTQSRFMNTIELVAIPEPVTLSYILTGVLMTGLLRRSRRPAKRV